MSVVSAAPTSLLAAPRRRLGRRAAHSSWGPLGGSLHGCISPADLAERVEHRGVGLQFGLNAPLMVEGRLSREGLGWRARSRWSTNTARLGNREAASPEEDRRAPDGRLVLITNLLMDTAAPRPPPPTLPLPPPPFVLLPAKPTLVRVTAEQHYDGDRPIDQATFYTRVGRADLRARLEANVTKRLVGTVGGGFAMGLGALLLGSYALGLGCVHFAGTPAAPGACLQGSTGLLVTSLVGLAGGLITVLWAQSVSPSVTTLAEDQDLAAQANERLERNAP